MIFLCTLLFHSMSSRLESIICGPLNCPEGAWVGLQQPSVKFNCGNEGPFVNNNYNP